MIVIRCTILYNSARNYYRFEGIMIRLDAQRNFVDEQLWRNNFDHLFDQPLQRNNLDQRFALAAPAGAAPPPPPPVGRRGGGCCDCWTPIARCVEAVAQAVWHAVRDLFRAIYHYFAADRAVNNDRLDGEDPNARLQGEIDAYCATWRRES